MANAHLNCWIRQLAMKLSSKVMRAPRKESELLLGSMPCPIGLKSVLTYRNSKYRMKFGAAQ